MKAPLSWAAWIALALTSQLAEPAEPTRTLPKLLPPAPPAKWLTDAKGCRFVIPAASAGLPASTIEWDGACVDGFVHGPGVLKAGFMVYTGDFARGEIVKGTAWGGGVTFEGTFRDNEPTGDVVVHMADGMTVKGKFDHGRLAAPQVEISWPNGAHYRGGVEQPFFTMHGTGVLEYNDGAVYEGAFKKGHVEGAGVMKLADGEVRRGTFVDGELDGKGSIVYANRSRYEGELRAGKPNGQGRMDFANDTYYEGAFVSGKYQGQGELKYTDGALYEGEFLAGQLSGSGTLTYADGSRYVGQFLYDKRHGTGLLTDVSGQTYEGDWKGDALTGKCRIVSGEAVYNGHCRNALFEGTGSLQIGPVTMQGEFRRNALIRGTIKGGDDGRAFEIDAEKGEILEVEKDGTKHPIDQLPLDLTI